MKLFARCLALVVLMAISTQMAVCMASDSLRKFIA